MTVLKGPPGYYCSAWPDANGHAYAGGCQSKGGGDCVATKNAYGRPYANGRGCKVTGGNKAFGWNWNVANRRVVFAHDDEGVLHLIHVSGADTNVVFRYLNGSYELQVLNTSGIGYLNGFTWTPSPGWSVKSIKKASGADCSLTRDGKDPLHRHRPSAELPLHRRRRHRVDQVHRRRRRRRTPDTCSGGRQRSSRSPR